MKAKRIKRAFRKQVQSSIKELINSLCTAPLKVRMIVCYRILIKRTY